MRRVLPRILARLLVGLLVGLAAAWLVAVGSAAGAVAAPGQGDPDSPPDSCFQPNDEGDLPTCSWDGTKWDRSYPDGSNGLGGFLVLAVLVGVAGVGFTVYKVSMARRMAERSGMDPGEATAMTLLTDDGLEATYLASNMRPPAPAPAAAPADGHPAEAPSARSATERLTELAQLRDQGLVTQAEYDERRAAILDSL